MTLLLLFAGGGVQAPPVALPTVPTARIVYVGADSRSIVVPAILRVVTVPSQSRVITVDEEEP
jgi:hypothetical protein